MKKLIPVFTITLFLCLITSANAVKTYSYDPSIPSQDDLCCLEWLPTEILEYIAFLYESQEVLDELASKNSSPEQCHAFLLNSDLGIRQTIEKKYKKNNSKSNQKLIYRAASSTGSFHNRYYFNTINFFPFIGNKITRFLSNKDEGDIFDYSFPLREQNKFKRVSGLNNIRKEITTLRNSKKSDDSICNRIEHIIGNFFYIPACNNPKAYILSIISFLESPEQGIEDFILSPNHSKLLLITSLPLEGQPKMALYKVYFRDLNDMDPQSKHVKNIFSIRLPEHNAYFFKVGGIISNTGDGYFYFSPTHSLKIDKEIFHTFSKGSLNKEASLFEDCMSNVVTGKKIYTHALSSGGTVAALKRILFDTSTHVIVSKEQHSMMLKKPNFEHLLRAKGVCKNFPQIASLEESMLNDKKRKLDQISP